MDIPQKPAWGGLLIAAQTGDTEAIRKLLEKGARPDELNLGGDTALIGAAQHDYTSIVEQLLDAGADINRTNTLINNRTALSVAAKGGHINTVRLLLKRQATTEGAALLEAAEAGHAEIARLLLDHGARINKPDEDGNTPLMLAAIGGHAAAVQVLLEHQADVSAADEDGYTALLHAALGGYTETIALLLDHGAKIDEPGLHGNTPLMWAVQNNHEAAVKLLLDRGAALDITNDDGDTALGIAGKFNRTDLAEVIQTTADQRVYKARMEAEEAERELRASIQTKQLELQQRAKSLKPKMRAPGS